MLIISAYVTGVLEPFRVSQHRPAAFFVACVTIFANSFLGYSLVCMASLFESFRAFRRVHSIQAPQFASKFLAASKIEAPFEMSDKGSTPPLSGAPPQNTPQQPAAPFNQVGFKPRAGAQHSNRLRIPCCAVPRLRSRRIWAADISDFAAAEHAAIEPRARRLASRLHAFSVPARAKRGGCGGCCRPERS